MIEVLDYIIFNPCVFIGCMVFLVIVLEGIRDIAAAAFGRRDKND